MARSTGEIANLSVASSPARLRRIVRDIRRHGWPGTAAHCRVDRSATVAARPNCLDRRASNYLTGTTIMTPKGNDPPGARHVLASWLNAGWKTGAILGGAYGAAYAALATGFFWFILIGLACGCVIGLFAGLVCRSDERCRHQRAGRAVGAPAGKPPRSASACRACRCHHDRSRAPAGTVHTRAWRPDHRYRAADGADPGRRALPRDDDCTCGWSARAPEAVLLILPMSASGGVAAGSDDHGESGLDRAGFGEHAVGPGSAAVLGHTGEIAYSTVASSPFGTCLDRSRCPGPANRITPLDKISWVKPKSTRPASSSTALPNSGRAPRTR